MELLKENRRKSVTLASCEVNLYKFIETNVWQTLYEFKGYCPQNLHVKSYLDPKCYKVRVSENIFYFFLRGF